MKHFYEYDWDNNQPTENTPKDVAEMVYNTEEKDSLWESVEGGLYVFDTWTDKEIYDNQKGDEYYTVDFGTGVKREEIETLDEAEKIAEEGMSYTQESVKIWYDNKPVAVSYWIGKKPTEEDDNVLLQIGDYGYYTNWVE